MSEVENTAPPEAVREGQEDTSPKRRGGRPGKIKRTNNSFRPGLSSEAKPTSTVIAKQKTWVFILPTDHDCGAIEEFTHLHLVASKFAESPQIGAVSSIQIRAKNWEIVVNLQVVDGKSDDEVVSEAFRILMPTIDAYPQFRTGFSRGRSSKWEFRVGNFVADEGGF